MLVTKNAVSTAMLEWMKSRERPTAAETERFVAAAIAGLNKINLEFEALRSETSEAPRVEPQD